MSRSHAIPRASLHSDADAPALGEALEPVDPVRVQDTGRTPRRVAFEAYRRWQVALRTHRQRLARVGLAPTRRVPEALGGFAVRRVGDDLG